MLIYIITDFNYFKYEMSDNLLDWHPRCVV
jgi:hypothetical protein